MTRSAGDPGLYCEEVDSYLNRSASAHGLRGTMGGLDSAGGGTRGQFVDPFTDRQRWDVARFRESERAWRALPKDDQEVLSAHYATGAQLLPRLYAQLGELAGAAMVRLKPKALGRLLRAVEAPALGDNAAVIQAARKRAEAAVRAAHRAWYAVRRQQRKQEGESWVA